MFTFGFHRLASTSPRLRSNSLGCNSRVPMYQGLEQLGLGFLDEATKIPRTSLGVLYWRSGTRGHILEGRFHQDLGWVQHNRCSVECCKNV